MGRMAMHGRISTFLLFVFLAGAAQIPSAAAETRVALVIGNSDYSNAEALSNPANDAADIAAALRDMGFDVRHEEDLGFDSMRRVLGAFSRKAAGADVALVFYAGHGIEIDRQNYLIPADAVLKNDTDVDYEAIPLDLVMRAVNGARKLKLVLLDACRNNPFQAQMSSSNRSRSIGRGLARVEPAVGTLVAFAAKEGTIADDGAGRNSPYTAALLSHLNEPGLEINFLFRKVRDAVLETTNGRQEPFTYGSLPSEAIYLTPPEKPISSKVAVAPGVPTVAVTPNFSEAATVWAVTQQSTSLAVLHAFAGRYPDTVYAVLAKARIAELEAENKVAVVSPPPAAPPPATRPGGKAPAITGCDKLAAVSYLVNAPEPDVLWEELDPQRAIPACTLTVSQYPDEPRLQLNLAQAYFKADRYEDYTRPLKLAVDAGYVPAFADWGAAHIDGVGVERNTAIARDYIQRAADAGEAHGVYWLGFLYLNGIGVPQDQDKSFELFTRADELGHVSAPDMLGRSYEEGHGVEIDLDRAREFYERGVSYGDSIAMNDLGQLYLYARGIEKDEKRAIGYFAKSAAGGNGDGLNNLGWVYNNGLGVEKDLGRALDYYLQSARKLNAVGMWNAASLIDEVKSGPNDSALMAEYLLAAINNGVENAQETLENGMSGWTRDSRTALQSFLKDHGYYDGAIDGRVGPATRRAATAYMASL